VMREYQLGPNGGILTALNLFTTKFDQVLALLRKRAQDVSYVLVDTPGQIEIFTWSASGAIITEALAQEYPTVVLYVMDTPMCATPATFMSNMLYACSIMYKTQLPFVIVFNKTDLKPHEFAVTWMRDFETFQQASQSESDESYAASLTASMALSLEEFYHNLRVTGVSALTGDGMEALFVTIDDAVKEYHEEYEVMMRRRLAEQSKVNQEQRAQLDRLLSDLKLDRSPNRTTGGAADDADVSEDD